jgi:hypothetical protein
MSTAAWNKWVYWEYISVGHICTLTPRSRREDKRKLSAGWLQLSVQLPRGINTGSNIHNFFQFSARQKMQIIFVLITYLFPLSLFFLCVSSCSRTLCCFYLLMCSVSYFLVSWKTYISRFLAHHPRRQPSLCAWLWELEISTQYSL